MDPAAFGNAGSISTTEPSDGSAEASNASYMRVTLRDKKSR
jgi:hypothetical protein